MNPIAAYRQRYRLHRAYSRYPRLTMLVDVAKSACYIGVVASVTWFGFSVATQKHTAPDTAQSVATAPQQPASTNRESVVTVARAKVERQSTLVGDVEIPAVATSARTDRVNVVPENAKPLILVSDPNHIYESNWIFILPADKFVIQFGSSPDRERLYKEAKAFPTGPVAIYPFKKTPSKRIVYGYSSGVYNSLDDARRAIQNMPESVVARGTWIRSVGALKKQIMGVSNNS